MRRAFLFFDFFLEIIFVTNFYFRLIFYYRYRTVANPDRIPNPCLNQHCRAVSTNMFSPVRHGSYCDGSTPKWQAFLCLNLLTPGPLFSSLSQACHSVILASGSLSPIPSLCAELSLFPADSGPATQKSSLLHTKDLVQHTTLRRLQNHPRPLQADHVVDLNKQLFAVTIGHFPDGSELKVTHTNYSKPGFLEKLGNFTYYFHFRLKCDLIKCLLHVTQVMPL